jgi:hypothetical protein
MKFCSSFGAVAFCLSVSSSALAASASPEEAKRLVGVFQSYLGDEPGVVKVTPAGETYDVKLDFAPLIKKAAKPGFTAEATPIVIKLTDQGAGKWLVTQDQSLLYSMKVPGQLDVSIKVGSMKGSSVFDQNLSAFSSSTSDFSDLTVDEKFTTPEAGETQVAYALKAMHYETTAKAAQNGGVDGTMRSTMSGLIERFTLPPSPTSPTPINVDVTVETGTSDVTYKGIKAQAIYKLVAWFVAHSSESAVKDGQAELKTLVGDGLPYFENISSTGTLQKLTAATPVGPVEIANLGYSIGMNGIVADGFAQESFSAEGLKLPAGLVPAWATGLVPDKFAFDFKISDFNLAEPAKIMLSEFDFTKKEPSTPEIDAKLLAAVMPKGAVTITMGPSRVVAKLFDLGFSGAMTAGPVGTPIGEASIKANGFDQVMDALKAAPPEMSGSAIAVMIAAKGMAKTETDGAMTWKIENTAAGGILVNGIDVSKMGGGG